MTEKKESEHFLLIILFLAKGKKIATVGWNSWNKDLVFILKMIQHSVRGWIIDEFRSLFFSLSLFLFPSCLSLWLWLFASFSVCFDHISLNVKINKTKISFWGRGSKRQKKAEHPILLTADCNWFEGFSLLLLLLLLEAWNYLNGWMYICYCSFSTEHSSKLFGPHLSLSSILIPNFVLFSFPLSLSLCVHIPATTQTEIKISAIPEQWTSKHCVVRILYSRCRWKTL